MPSTVREMAHIEFTPAKHKQLRRAYNKAVKDGRAIFVFEGHELDARYAGYLLEYLDMKLEKHHGHQSRH